MTAPAPSPVSALDYLSIGVADLPAETANYTALLGSGPLWTGAVERAESAVFSAGNCTLCLVEAPGAAGLDTLCFAVDDLARLRRRLARLGMGDATACGDPLAAVAGAGAVERLDEERTRGLPLAFAQRSAGPRRAQAGANEASVSGLDHLVIASTDAAATAFLLAAQLGLDLRMDLHRPAWGARLLFFRCGDSIVEVMQPLAETPEPATGDSFYGLSWRVQDATAARARLAALGFDVSPVRDGRKRGTRVFSVRDRTAGVATLMLQPAETAGD